MKNRSASACGFIIFTIALLPAAALGHDDGLTCHTHPSPPPRHQNWIMLDSVHFGGGLFGLRMSEVIHRFDNLIAEKPQQYVSGEVRSLRQAVTELQEAVSMVSLLIRRADRHDGRAHNKLLLGLAHDLYMALKLDSLLSFSALRDTARYGRPVRIEFPIFLRYLSRNPAVSDDLIITMNQAAQSCS